MPQLLSSDTVSAECKACLGSNFGSNAMQVAEGAGIAILESDRMPRAMSGNEDIISKSPGADTQRAHVSGPGGEKKGDHGHAERTALGDAAPVSVGFPKPSCNSVVVHCSSVECRVASQDPSGATSKCKESAKKFYLNLVEALPNVGGTTRDLFA